MTTENCKFFRVIMVAGWNPKISDQNNWGGGGGDLSKKLYLGGEGGGGQNLRGNLKVRRGAATSIHISKTC